MIRTGLDRILKNHSLVSHFGRIGLVTSQSVTTSQGISCVEVLTHAVGNRLVCVFGPQHGYYQTEQDNMIETPHQSIWLSDGREIPLFSLYSESRLPTHDQLANVDTIVVDLLDIGCRVYTYMLTMAACLRVASVLGKKVVVLDRPNPLGLSEKQASTWTKVQGNVLDMRWESFVGWYPIAMRHGLTMGELGHYFIQSDKLTVDYQVIAVDGLKRNTPLSELAQLPWTLPSPNIPSWLSAFFFPSYVSLECTNISEGRGTTQPFQLVGAPFLEPEDAFRQIQTHCARWQHQGSSIGIGEMHARRHDFRPTFNKHHGQICKGLWWSNTNYECVDTFALGIGFLAACASQAHIAKGTRGEQNHLMWKEPGYEYNTTDSPIHLVLGQECWKLILDRIVENGLVECIQKDLDDCMRAAYNAAQSFAIHTEQCHIYS